MAADKTATFAIDLQSNASAVAQKENASLGELKAAIESSKEAAKGMAASLRALRGSSDEVAAAKKQLTAQIDAERGATSQLNLALLKQGTSYDKLATEAKKAAGAHESMLKGAAEAKKKAVDAEKEASAEAAENLTAVVGAAGVAVGAFVALGVAVGVAAEKVSEFVVTSANQLRSMGLVREAASGSAANAAALGSQVDDLSHKVATSKEKLNELGSAIVQNLSGGLSKASGKAIEDTFYAVSEASAAMGDSVGNALKGLVERGKQFNRFSLSPQDLQGTQIQFQEVAASLAKNLNIGLDQAKASLYSGQVTLGAGAKALRDTVEKNFGDVNAKKLLDLDVQEQKFKEHLIGLTSGVTIEPLLKELDKLLSLFDEDTIAGQGIKAIFTSVGDALNAISPDVFSTLNDFIEEGVELALDFALAIKDINDKLVNFGGLWGVSGKAIEGASAATTGGGDLGNYDAEDAADAAKQVADAKAAADAMGDGLAAGITAQSDKVADASRGLAKAANNAFVDEQGIHSPSTKWAEFGRNTGEGYAGGLEDSAPRAQDAADKLAPSAPGGGAAGGGGAGGPVMVSITINVPESMAKAGAEKLAAAMTTPAILAQITKAVRDGAITQGIPTQQSEAA